MKDTDIILTELRIMRQENHDEHETITQRLSGHDVKLAAIEAIRAQGEAQRAASSRSVKIIISVISVLVAAAGLAYAIAS